MRKTVELLKLINAKKDEIRNFESQELMDDAAKAAGELQKMNQEYSIAKSIEDSDMATFTTGVKIENIHKPDVKTIRQLFNRAVFSEHPKLNRFFKPLNEEEMQILNAAGTPGQVEATPAKGGYLVPQEEFNRILEVRRQLMPLKQFCEVIPVMRNTGKVPTVGEETGVLTNFDEINDIATSDIDFGQVAFATADYGDIIPVSNSLLADTDFDLIGLIRGRFAKKSVNTENAKIVAKMQALTPAAGTSWKDLAKAINKTLDPAIAAMASVYTNQDGWDYLDELTDTQGRPIMTASLADPGTYMFKGKPVRVIKTSLLANVSGAFPFYAGLLSDYIKFIDRQGVEIAVSTEALFAKNTTAVRAIERFDVATDDAAAVASVNLTIA